MTRLLPFALVLFFEASFAQQEVDTKSYLKRQSKRIEVVLTAAQLHPHDTIADIGAGKGKFDVALGLYSDSLVFDLEEIDSSSLTQNHINGYVKIFSSTRSVTNLYHVHYGTASGTGLPSGHYDKLFLFDVYHHLDDKPAFLKELKRILKTNGSLILCEMIAPRSGYFYKPCKKTLYTVNELKDAFGNKGFELDQVYTTVKSFGMKVRYFRFRKM